MDDKKDFIIKYIKEQQMLVKYSFIFEESKEESNSQQRSSKSNGGNDLIVDKTAGKPRQNVEGRTNHDRFGGDKSDTSNIYGIVLESCSNGMFGSNAPIDSPKLAIRMKQGNKVEIDLCSSSSNKIPTKDCNSIKSSKKRVRSNHQVRLY
jgi:hypothetical protein